MLQVFVVLYLLLTVGIGFYATRYIKNARDFVNTGRGLPLVFNAFALFALWYGAETVFGASGRFVEGGVLGIIEDPLGSVLCLVLFGLFLARPLYRQNILTLGDLLGKAYGRKVELISSVIMLFSFFGFIAAQFVALAISLKIVFGMDLTMGVFVASVIVTLYTYIGGMWAISISDLLQSVIIILGMGLLCVELVTHIGSLDMVMAQAPAGHFRFFPHATAADIDEWVSAWMVIGLGSLASQDVFQRVNSARTEKSAVYSTFLGAGMYLLFSCLPMLIALCARIVNPEIMNAGDSVDLQEVIPMMVLNHSSVFVQVLFFGALLSAILSTCSGALLAPSTILAENIIKPLTGKDSAVLQLKTVKISILVMAAISTTMALVEKDIYKLVGDSSIVALVCILVPVFAAVYHKKPSRTGAFCAMSWGLVFWATREYATSVGALLPDSGWETFFKAYNEIHVSAWIIGPLGSLLGYVCGWLWETRVSVSPINYLWTKIGRIVS
ncbi:MAG: sodium:solute symporter family protein [Marinifilaceae bacterium]